MSRKIYCLFVLFFCIPLGTGCTSQVNMTRKSIRSEKYVKKMYVGIKSPWRLSKRITNSFTDRSVREFILVEAEIKGQKLVGYVSHFRTPYGWRRVRPVEVKVGLKRIEYMYSYKVDAAKTASLLVPIALVVILGAVAGAVSP